jgi:antirestriction protein ArdC
MKERTDTNRASLYADVTRQVIAVPEAGRLPWVQPWDGMACGSSMPHNAGSRRRYFGIEALNLLGAVVEGVFLLAFRGDGDGAPGTEIAG